MTTDILVWGFVFVVIVVISRAFLATVYFIPNWQLALIFVAFLLFGIGTAWWASLNGTATDTAIAGTGILIAMFGSLLSSFFFKRCPRKEDKVFVSGEGATVYTVKNYNGAKGADTVIIVEEHNGEERGKRKRFPRARVCQANWFTRLLLKII